MLVIRSLCQLIVSAMAFVEDPERGELEKVFAQRPLISPPSSPSSTRAASNLSVTSSASTLLSTPSTIAVPLPTLSRALSAGAPKEKLTALEAERKAVVEHIERSTPPKALKKRASRLIQFRLWFNTYRLV